MARVRRVSTWFLLTFVIFTGGYAVGKEVGVRRALARLPATPPQSLGSASSGAESEDSVAVWYFHSTKRCKKCNTIESYAKETLDTLFADAAADGTITWQTANIDDVWNADAVRRYGLVRSSLVLVDMRGGVENDHAVLHRTWELTDDKETFLAYVESEIEMIRDSWTEDQVEGADEGEE